MKDRKFGKREKESQEQSSGSTEELWIQEKRKEEHSKYLGEVSVNAK